MTTYYDFPQANWLLPETPLGRSPFTPFRVRLATENCRFAMDAQVVRMVYIGGLSTYDGNTLWWLLYGPAQPQQRGIETRNAWLTENESISERASIAFESTELPSSPGHALAIIEDISGASRRRLTYWLETSHTTLNGIAHGRKPRSSLAFRITALYRLVRRLQALHVSDSDRIRDALTVPALNGKSALDYAFVDDYENAATAAQLALNPRKKLIAIRGATFGDLPTTAVEDL